MFEAAHETTSELQKNVFKKFLFSSNIENQRTKNIKYLKFICLFYMLYEDRATIKS